MVVSVKESSYLNDMPRSDLINTIHSNMTVIKHYRKKMDNIGYWCLQQCNKCEHKDKGFCSGCIFHQIYLEVR